VRVLENVIGLRGGERARLVGLADDELREERPREEILRSGALGACGDRLEEDDGVRLRAAPAVRSAQRSAELPDERVDLGARERVDERRLVELVAQREQRGEIGIWFVLLVDLDRHRAVVEEPRRDGHLAVVAPIQQRARSHTEVHVERRRCEDERLRPFARQGAALDAQRGRRAIDLIEHDFTADVEHAVAEDATSPNRERRAHEDANPRECCFFDMRAPS
jgi:hypothetical protein